MQGKKVLPKTSLVALLAIQIVPIRPECMDLDAICV